MNTAVVSFISRLGVTKTMTFQNDDVDQLQSEVANVVKLMKALEVSFMVKYSYAKPQIVTLKANE